VARDNALRMPRFRQMPTVIPPTHVDILGRPHLINMTEP
jgi:hypothetical protein